MNNIKTKNRNLNKILTMNTLGILIIYFIITKLTFLKPIFQINLGPISLDPWALSLFISQLLFWLYRTHLWKINIFNSGVPVISGRWEGTLIRTNEAPYKEHPFILEIKQDLVSISCKSFSNNSSSKSIISELRVEDNNTCLHFSWAGGTENTNNEKQHRTNNFLGYTHLELSDNNKVLKGYYFTDRKPTTTEGKIHLIRTHSPTKNMF